MSADHSIQELSRTRLRLRDDLVFTPQRFNGEPCYVIESQAREKFFRIGVPEYTFISLLDGSISVAEATSLTARELEAEAFSEAEATQICRWLIDSGLAINVDAALQSEMKRRRATKPEHATLQKLNPFWMKLPLFNPDNLLRKANKHIGWTHSRVAFVIWCVVAAYGASAVFGDWERFIASSGQLFSVSNWFWLGLAWILLKAVHEFSHGLACRRYGGEVRETGLIFILFAPMAYVDLTSSWRFTSRWMRIHTALAGMYFELFIAAAAAILWSRTTSVELSYHFVNLMVLASVTTLMFNANPLMRFDGYYALADLLDLPHLYTDGQQYVQRLGRRLFFGRSLPHNMPGGWRGVFIRLYGIAAFIWKFVVCFGMLIGAATIFHGAGLALAAIGLVLWVALPTIKLGNTIATEFRRDSSRIGRFTAAIGTVAVAASFTFFVLPWPGGRSAPAIVEYLPLTVIRAETPGFVERIHVRDGQPVRENDILLTLRNDEVRNEYDDLLISIEQARTQHQIHKQDNELGKAQIESQKVRSLQRQLAEKTVEYEALTIRAPRNGNVVARDLALLVDAWLEKGEEVLVIGDDSCKEVQAAIAQHDIDSFRARRKEPIVVHVIGESRIEGTLTRLTPRAGIEPPHDALCSSNGGPLAVKQTESDEDGQPAFELVDPHFTAYVRLPAEAAEAIPTGRKALVTLKGDDRNFGTGLIEVATRWANDTAQTIGLR